MAKKQLVELQINEVSGVDKAANLRTFLIIKGAGGEETSFADKVKAAVEAFGKSLGLVKDNAEVATVVEEFTKKMKADFPMPMAEDKDPKKDPSEDPMVDPKKKEEIKKTGGDEMTPEQIQKSIDDAVAAAIVKATENVTAENTSLKKQLDDLQKSQSEQLVNLQKAAFVTVAKGFDKVEADASKLGDLLFKCSTKLEKADYEALEGMLKAANERIAEGDLLKEAGSSSEDIAKGEKAVIEKVNAAAAKLMSADPKLTKEMAFTKALSDDPKLYAEYSKTV